MKGTSELGKLITDIEQLSVTKIWLIIGILLVGVFARKLFSRSVVAILRRYTHKGNIVFREEYLEALIKPLSLVFVIGALHLANVLAKPPENLSSFVDLILQTLGVVAVFWAFFELIEPISHIHERRKGSMSSEVRDFLGKAGQILVVIVAILTIFQVWGKDVTTFLAGLGLFGMAVALAAQDTIKNIFGCIAILMDKTFRKGDWIKTPEVEGVVENIGFRTTTIRQFDKALVHIPNSKLADAAVINFAKMTNRRVSWEIGLTYDTTADALEKIVSRIRNFLTNHPDVESDPKRVTTLVNLDKFADSSINIFCYFFSKSINWNDYMRVKEECLLAIKRIVEEEGGEFAFPTRSIHLESVPKEVANSLKSFALKKQKETQHADEK